MSSAFVSHVSEEASVASVLKRSMDRDFLGQLNMFLSSDTDSIAAGDHWLSSVEAALKSADVLVILCSPRSIERPWVNFEAGAAWILGKPIIPLCHSGLTPRDLPMPLSLRQGVSLGDSHGLRILYDRIASVIPCRMPEPDFEQLARGLRKADASITTTDRERDWLDDRRNLAARVRQSLESGRYNWRSLERVATEAAASEEIVADLLRADSDVRFSKGRSGRVIVGLVSRVGEP